MAVLSANDLALVYADLVAGMNVATSETVGALVRADLKAAIAAADSWADSNAASFNSAIPQPARGALTARQKARLLMAVVKRRFEVS